MRFSAVVFDLFGTIIGDIAGQPYERAAQKMASVLSVDHNDFSRLWFATVYERNTGHFPTLKDNVAYICRQLGISANEEQLSAAAEIRHNLARQSMMTPRAGSLDTIHELRKRNLKIGLISDCSPSEPEIWPDTPFVPLFDATIFSPIAKMKKPDPKIYEFVATKLGVKCADCLYVGNGGSDEIRGAHEASMYPVLILPEYDSEAHVLPSNEIVEYANNHGKVISALQEILQLI